MSVTSIVALTAVATSTAGLVFVGWSVRILVLQMRTQSHQAIYAHQQEVDALIFQRLDLKPIIEGRRPLPDPEDDLYEDVMAGVELFLTMFEHVWAAADTMSPEVGRQWQAYIRDIAAGVAFRAYLGGKPMDWYSPGFLKYVGYDASTLGVAPASPDAGVPSTPGPRNRSTSPP